MSRCSAAREAVIARLDRAIQYSEAFVVDGEAAAYWIAPSRAMTSWI